MKTLCLIRHAKSYPQDPPLTDFERRLTERGQQDADDMGRQLSQYHFMPDVIMTSPARRARQTADHIAAALELPAARIQEQPRIYMASLPNLITTLREIDSDCKQVVLIGHNPGMTELANRITDLALANLPTCGMVLVEFTVSSWSDIDGTKGKALHYDFPQTV